MAKMKFPTGKHNQSTPSRSLIRVEPPVPMASDSLSKTSIDQIRSFVGQMRVVCKGIDDISEGTILICKRVSTKIEFLRDEERIIEASIWVEGLSFPRSFLPDEWTSFEIY